MEHLTAVLREIVFVWHWLLRAVPWHYKRRVAIKLVWVNKAHYSALWNHSSECHCACLVTGSIYGTILFSFFPYDIKCPFSCSQDVIFWKSDGYFDLFQFHKSDSILKKHFFRKKEPISSWCDKSLVFFCHCCSRRLHVSFLFLVQLSQPYSVI